MKRHAPAALRNREPILQILEQVLPEQGTILEIGAGSGEHAVFVAPRFPNLRWQPTDADPTAVASIAAWRDELPSDNLLDPRRFDARDRPWPFGDLAGIVAINVIHISPWEVCEALIEGAGRTLQEDGVLYFYGPFKIDGRHTALSNEAFDLNLQSQDPSWGVRDLADVRSLAARHGLRERGVFPMPVNNLSVVFSKSAG